MTKSEFVLRTLELIFGAIGSLASAAAVWIVLHKDRTHRPKLLMELKRQGEHWTIWVKNRGPVMAKGATVRVVSIGRSGHETGFIVQTPLPCDVALNPNEPHFNATIPSKGAVPFSFVLENHGKPLIGYTPVSFDNTKALEYSPTPYSFDLVYDSVFTLVAYADDVDPVQKKFRLRNFETGLEVDELRA